MAKGNISKEGLSSLLKLRNKLEDNIKKHYIKENVFCSYCGRRIPENKEKVLMRGWVFLKDGKLMNNIIFSSKPYENPILKAVRVKVVEDA